MTWRVKADLTMPNTLFRDSFKASLDSRIATATLANVRTVNDINETGRTGLVLDYGFALQQEADVLYDWIRALIGQTGGATGFVHIHDCPHETGGAAPYACNTARAQYREFRFGG